MALTDLTDLTNHALSLELTGALAAQDAFDQAPGNTGVGALNAPADGSVIGQVTAMIGPYGAGAMTAGWVTGGGPLQPILKTDPSTGGGACIFDDGVLDNGATGIAINQSFGALAFIHQNTATGGWTMRARIYPKSVTGSLMISSNQAANNTRGYRLFLSTGKLALQIHDGTSLIYNFSGAITGGTNNTGTLLTINTSYNLVVSWSGNTGASQFTYTITPQGGSDQVYTPGTSLAASAAGTNPSAGLIWVGVQNATLSPFVGYISWFAVQKTGTPTAADNSGAIAYTPAQVTSFTSGTGGNARVRKSAAYNLVSGGVPPNAFNGMYRWYDFRKTSTLYQDTAGSQYVQGTYNTAATADGNPVGTVQSRVEAICGLPNGVLIRDLVTDATSTGTVVLKTNPASANGMPCALFAGVSGVSWTNLLWQDPGGLTNEHTYFVLGQNLSVSSGSEFMGGNCTQFGSAEVDDNTARMRLDVASGTIPNIDQTAPTTPAESTYFCYWFRKNPTQFKAFVNTTAGGSGNPIALTGSNWANPYETGKDINNGYHLNGRVWTIFVSAFDLGDTYGSQIAQGLLNSMKQSGTPIKRAGGGFASRLERKLTF
jgi:hypothetical protein